MVVSTFPFGAPRHCLPLLIRKDEAELEMYRLAYSGVAPSRYDVRSIAWRKLMLGVCCACAKMPMFPEEAITQYPIMLKWLRTGTGADPWASASEMR
jgi:hypothetical protein